MSVNFYFSVQEEKYTCGGKIKRQSRNFGSQECRNWIRKEGSTVSEFWYHQLTIQLNPFDTQHWQYNHFAFNCHWLMVIDFKMVLSLTFTEPVYLRICIASWRNSGRTYKGATMSIRRSFCPAYSPSPSETCPSPTSQCRQIWPSYRATSATLNRYAQQRCSRASLVLIVLIEEHSSLSFSCCWLLIHIILIIYLYM